MNLERVWENNFKKKGKGGCSLAGRRQPTGPASEASPGLPAPRPPPSPRARTRPRHAHPTVSGRRRRTDGMRGSPAPRPPPPLWTAPAPSPLSPPPCAHSLALSPAFSPPLRVHRTAFRHRSSPSSLRLVPGTSSPPNASFHLSELRICLRVLGRAFFAHVSCPRGPNRSPESARPRRSSPRRRRPWLSLSRPSLASLARAPWSPWLPESREAALTRSTGVWWPAPLRQHRRSAIAGGQLAVLGFKASGGVGSSRKRETNALVPLVSAGRPHRRRAVDGDLLPSLRSGQRARLAGGSARQ